MHPSQIILTFCLATAAAAVPAFNARSDEAPEEATIMPDLEANEVLFNGQNGWEALSTDAYEALLEENGVSLVTPAIDYDFLEAFESEEVNATESSLEKRQCSNTAYLITKTETFVDWDLQMSPLVIARNRDMTIGLTQSYTVTDTLSVSGSVSPTIIKTWLSGTLGFSVSRSWATATAITIGGTVEAGHTGAMVHNAWKTRRYGQVLRGCIGSQRVVSTFMSDVYEHGSYNGVRWVRGAVSLCQRRGALNKLARCQGGGFLE